MKSYFEFMGGMKGKNVSNTLLLLNAGHSNFYRCYMVCIYVWAVLTLFYWSSLDGTNCCCDIMFFFFSILVFFLYLFTCSVFVFLT